MQGFDAYAGANQEEEDVVREVSAEEAPEVEGPIGIGAYWVRVSPNAVREARLHFGCPELVGALLERSYGDASWDLSPRHFNVRPRTKLSDHIFSLPTGSDPGSAQTLALRSKC